MTLRALALLACLFLVCACTQKPIKVENKDGVVSSIGPVFSADADHWTLVFSVYDNDGDPVDVTAEYQVSNGSWTALSSCKGEETPCLIGGLHGLNSRKDYGHQQHQVLLRHGTLTLETTSIRMYALEDQSDVVDWTFASQAP